VSTPNNARFYPDLTTLPKRVEYAAGVAAEIAARERAENAGVRTLTPNASDVLMQLAQRWEAADRVESEKDARVKTLAGLLRQFSDEYGVLPAEPFDVFTYVARQLVAIGWRPGDSA
jgi:hypothetical protein